MFNFWTFGRFQAWGDRAAGQAVYRGATTSIILSVKPGLACFTLIARAKTPFARVSIDYAISNNVQYVLQ